MRMPDASQTATSSAPIKLPPKTRRPLLEFALPAVALASGIMLLLAVIALLNADDLLDYAKAVTLAFSATAVSYGINKLAIERGAELGTTGYHGATALSILSILAVGIGLFAATYAGLTLKDTAELQLQQHGQALGDYVGARSGAASEAARVNPAIRAIEADLLEKAACEIATSCISGRGNGGNGTVARAVAEHAGRAASIGQQIAAGEAARAQIIARLNDDIVLYQTIIADEERDVWERRSRVQVVDARIRQSIGELDAVVPLPLIAAYASELQSGIGIPGRPEAEARLNGILLRHGKSLAAVLDGIEDIETVPPSFPARAGVSDTFRYVHHFQPIAAIAAVVELVFPIVLWAYTFWALAWTKYKLQPRAADTAGAVRSTEPLHDPDPHTPGITPAADKPRRGRNGYAPRERGTHPDN